MIFSVTKNGRPLDPSLYTWDERNRTFYTNEYNLVLDFSNINGVTFKTGYGCTFNTGSNCTFKTGSYCTFNTGFYCIFYTFSHCTFKTAFNCVVIRRDVFEVIKLEKEVNHIKLNGYNVLGYEEIKSKEQIEKERLQKSFEFSEEEFEI